MPTPTETAMTPKKIEEMIAARQAEGQAVINEHTADEKAFQQRRAQRQQKITHIEGMILQLQELLPKKPEKGAKKKK